jgi:hypothetical protein
MMLTLLTGPLHCALKREQWRNFKQEIPFIFFTVTNIFLCRHELNGTDFTCHFLFHYIQGDTKLTWHYRQQVTWKLLTKHLHLLSILTPALSSFYTDKLAHTAYYYQCHWSVCSNFCGTLYDQCKPNAYKICTTHFFFNFVVNATLRHVSATFRGHFHAILKLLSRNLTKQKSQMSY